MSDYVDRFPLDFRSDWFKSRTAIFNIGDKWLTYVFIVDDDHWLSSRNHGRNVEAGVTSSKGNSRSLRGKHCSRVWNGDLINYVDIQTEDGKFCVLICSAKNAPYLANLLGCHPVYVGDNFTLN